jgi:hypothetical protein
MEKWYSVMIVNDDDCLIPIYFAKDKEVALSEYNFYNTQSNMEHREHKKVIFSESTQIVTKVVPRHTKFALDFFDDGESIEGITFGDTWNGWACPYFTFENGMKLLNWFDEGYLSYDAEKDVFNYVDDNYDDCVDSYKPTIIEGKKYYCIGGYNFCWYEVKQNDMESVD